MKTLIALSALTTVFATNVFAAPGQPKSDAAPHYAYGQKLDVQRVISITDVSQQVGVVPVTLVYEDSEGQVRQVVFSQIGGGASGG